MPRENRFDTRQSEDTRRFWIGSRTHTKQSERLNRNRQQKKFFAITSFVLCPFVDAFWLTWTSIVEMIQCKTTWSSNENKLTIFQSIFSYNWLILSTAIDSVQMERIPHHICIRILIVSNFSEFRVRLRLNANERWDETRQKRKKKKTGSETIWKLLDDDVGLSFVDRNGDESFKW